MVEAVKQQQHEIDTLKAFRSKDTWAKKRTIRHNARIIGSCRLQKKGVFDPLSYLGLSSETLCGIMSYFDPNPSLPDQEANAEFPSSLNALLHPIAASLV
jgi:hypothetical protein